MLTFTHVEDYIELLAGYEPGGTSVLFNTNKYTFSLARYDVKIVESMANSTVWGSMALTDKQGELALKLVEKYRRQYANHGIDITSIIENPQWRMPLRKVDRTQRIWLEDGEIRIKFPYNQNWIDDIRKFKEVSQGYAEWRHDEKYWSLGLTEYNVNWAVVWGETWKIDIDPEVQSLYNKILLAETEPYEIKLVQRDDCFEIVNAAESLVNYVNKHLGGFGLDNVTRLVDSAGVLGYTIDRGIKYDELLDLFGLDRLIHVPSTEEGSLDLIFDYAELTNRWPVYIYNPGTSQKIDLDRFKDSEIVKFDPAGRTKTPDYNFWTTKVIYVNKIPKEWSWPIPLLVSTVEMMYGGSRMDWMTRAEKVIHYSYVPLREKL
jgi:hypothetical protein